MSLFDFMAEDDETFEREIQLRTPTGKTLRPYQQEAVENVFADWAAGHRAVLVTIPTGGGKSVIFSEVMRRWSEQCSEC